MFETPSIKAKTIQIPAVNASSIGQTGDWTNTVQRIDLGLSNHQRTMEQLKGGEGKDQTKLEARIEKAKAEGKDAKAARLEGRKERGDIRDANKASRITARNIDKKNKLTKKEFFKGQKFNEKQKEKGGATSDSHLFKPLALSLQPEGITETKPEFSLVSPFNMKTFDKFSKIAKDI